MKSRAKQKAGTRDLILSSAARRITKHGIQGASVAEIARASVRHNLSDEVLYADCTKSGIRKEISADSTWGCLMNELERFLITWDHEAKNTVKLMQALPAAQYDFRPDPGGRSVGELAWHLAEGDAYMSYGIENREFSMGMKPPNIARPRAVEALAPGYERLKPSHFSSDASLRDQTVP